MYTPVALGGFGFSPEFIAIFTAIAGAAQAAWLLLVFPPLHGRVGTGKILWFCACAWPVFFALSPVFNFMRFHGQDRLFWATAPPALVLGSGVAMAFSELFLSSQMTITKQYLAAVQLALNDIAPSHETLGTLNSISLAVTSGIRAIAPAIATSVFAIGVKYHILCGYLFWFTNVLVALGLLAVLRFLPEKAKGNVARRPSGHV